MRQVPVPCAPFRAYQPCSIWHEPFCKRNGRPCYWFPCSCVQPPLHGEGKGRNKQLTLVILAELDYLRGRLEELFATSEIVYQNVGVKEYLLQHPCFFKRYSSRALS